MNQPTEKAIRRVLAWVTEHADEIRELKARVGAEVDKRIATHPDLADLDDWLDDHYGGGR